MLSPACLHCCHLHCLVTLFLCLPAAPLPLPVLLMDLMDPAVLSLLGCLFQMASHIFRHSLESSLSFLQTFYFPPCKPGESPRAVENYPLLYLAPVFFDLHRSQVRSGHSCVYYRYIYNPNAINFAIVICYYVYDNNTTIEEVNDFTFIIFNTIVK